MGRKVGEAVWQRFQQFTLGFASPATAALATLRAPAWFHESGGVRAGRSLRRQGRSCCRTAARRNGQVDKRHARRRACRRLRIETRSVRGGRFAGPTGHRGSAQRPARAGGGDDLDADCDRRGRDAEARTGRAPERAPSRFRSRCTAKGERLARSFPPLTSDAFGRSSQALGATTNRASWDEQTNKAARGAPRAVRRRGVTSGGP